MNATPDRPDFDPMDYGWEAQRQYCIRLGIITADAPDWYQDPTAAQVCGFLENMRVQRDRMDSAEGWIQSALDSNRLALRGPDIRSAGLRAGDIARHSLDYSLAAAAYDALEERLQALVVAIRRGQGYETDAFARLEQHPALSPADDGTVRALAKLERHLADFRSRSWTDPARRRHLREAHAMTPAQARQGDPIALHDEAHAGELAALRERVAAIKEANPDA